MKPPPLKSPLFPNPPLSETSHARGFPATTPRRCDSQRPIGLPGIPDRDQGCCGRDRHAARSVPGRHAASDRSEEHTSELQSRQYLVCRLLLEKKKTYSSS